jgi:glycosyltransferase involved in cell wall biosynthesis
MKILFVAEKYPPTVGGGETHLHQLAEGLAARGHDVTVLTEPTDQADPHGYRSGTVRIREVTGLAAACERFDCKDAVTALHAAFTQDRYDVVHVINYVPAILTSLLRPVVPGRLVVSLFETLIPGTRVFDLWKEWGVEASLRQGLSATLRPDLHVCGSQNYEDWVREAGFTEPSVVVTFGTDLTAFAPTDEQRAATRADLGLDGRQVLFIPARPVPRKRIEDAITALARILPSVPDACLLLTAPTGRSNQAYCTELDRLTHSHGLDDHVTWVEGLGWQDMPALYAACDAVVMPSAHESWGIALTEAMASRRPVVTTDIKGHWEVVDDERTALLYQPGDVDTLAKALTRVLTDDVSDMVERAHQEALARFSVEACVLGHERAYDQVRDRV